jgi:acyl-CoA thioesterase-1
VARGAIDPYTGIVVSSALLALAAAAAVTAGVPSDAPPRIVALGDSLSSGHDIGEARAFPAIIQRRLADNGYRFTVVNAGVSGDTSARARARYREALRGDVRVLILALGANDGLRGLPVDQFRRNLADIIEDAQSRGIDVLLCAMEALPIYGWNYTMAFHQVYVDLAKRYGVPLVPFMMMNVIGNPALMLPDRVHPNADGARAIADHIWPYLDALLARSAYSRSAT